MFVMATKLLQGPKFFLSYFMILFHASPVDLSTRLYRETQTHDNPQRLSEINMALKRLNKPTKQ